MSAEVLKIDSYKEAAEIGKGLYDLGVEILETHGKRPTVTDSAQGNVQAEGAVGSYVVRILKMNGSQNIEYKIVRKEQVDAESQNRNISLDSNCFQATDITLAPERDSVRFSVSFDGDLIARFGRNPNKIGEQHDPSNFAEVLPELKKYLESLHDAFPNLETDITRKQEEVSDLQNESRQETMEMFKAF